MSSHSLSLSLFHLVHCIALHCICLHLSVCSSLSTWFVRRLFYTRLLLVVIAAADFSGSFCSFHLFNLVVPLFALSHSFYSQNIISICTKHSVIICTIAICSRFFKSPTPHLFLSHLAFSQSLSLGPCTIHIYILYVAVVVFCFHLYSCDSVLFQFVLWMLLLLLQQRQLLQLFDAQKDVVKRAKRWEIIATVCYFFSDDVYYVYQVQQHTNTSKIHSFCFWFCISFFLQLFGSLVTNRKSIGKRGRETKNWW